MNHLVHAEAFFDGFLQEPCEFFLPSLQAAGLPPLSLIVLLL